MVNTWPQRVGSLSCSFSSLWRKSSMERLACPRCPAEQRSTSYPVYLCPMPRAFAGTHPPLNCSCLGVRRRQASIVSLCTSCLVLCQTVIVWKLTHSCSPHLKPVFHWLHSQALVCPSTLCIAALIKKVFCHPSPSTGL